MICIYANIASYDDNGDTRMHSALLLIFHANFGVSLRTSQTDKKKTNAERKLIIHATNVEMNMNEKTLCS